MMRQEINIINDLHWRYRILETLGKGGEGEVYLAEDKLCGRSVVVKASFQNSGQDLKREFIRLYRLNHPGLLKAYDFYCRNKKSLAVYEYFPGSTLESYIGQNKPNREGLWGLWLRLTGIVAYLHGREYIHGDIKPENILIGRDGKIKLIDLGLARKTGDQQFSGFSGTAEYSAPEVLIGNTAPGQSSDVYGLGLLLFQMMTGKLPPVRVRLEENQPWSLILRDYLDDKQSEIAVRALNFWPHQRFHSALQLVQALGQSGYGCCLEQSDDFRFNCQGQALAKAVEHLRSDKPGRLVVYSGPGRGKTAFLKELNFIRQISGKSSVLLDRGDGIQTKRIREVPDDEILLIDGLPDEETRNWLLKRSGRAVIAGNQAPLENDDPADFLTLKKFCKQDYSAIISGYFPGIRDWELGYLSDWIWRQAGGNIAYARLYLEHCLSAGTISQLYGHWQFDWQKLFADQCLPDAIAVDIEQRWKPLDIDSRNELKQACISEGNQKLLEKIDSPEYWLDENGRIDSDLLRVFLLRQIGPEDEATVNYRPAAGHEPICPSSARWAFWKQREQWQYWLDEGRGLMEQAQRNSELEKMLYVGGLLADSGRLGGEEQIRLTRELTGLYQRVNRWSSAIELWTASAGQMSGEWEYHQMLARLYANKGDHAAALEILESGANSVTNDDQRCLYLAYKGWVLGLQGREEDAKAVFDLALEAAGSGGCSQSTCFELYNSLARHYQLSNDFKRVAHWAEKASVMEISDPLKKAGLLNILGHGLWQAGDPARAKTFIERSIGLLEDLGQNNLLCYPLCNLGLINISLKEWHKALMCLEKAGGIYDVADGLALYASITGNLALVYGALSQSQISREKYLEAHQYYSEIGDVQGRLICLSNAALKDHLAGRTEYAIRTLKHCREQAVDKRSDYAAVIAGKDLGMVYAEEGRYAEALEIIGEAVSLASARGFRPNWDCFYYGALAAGELNDPAAMNDHLGMAQTRAGNPIEKAQLKMLEGIYMAKKGDPNKGLGLAMEAAGELKNGGEPAESAKVWLRTGELAAGSEDYACSEKLVAGLLSAESEFQKMGAPAYLDRTREAILAVVRRLFSSGSMMPGTQMLEGLYQIAALLDPGKKQSELAQGCLEVTVKLLKAERGGLFLTDENSKLYLAAKTDLDPDTQNDALEFSSQAVMEAAAGETMVVSNDAQLDEALNSRLSVKRNVIRSLLCLPLRSREGTLGAIYLDSRLKPGIFNQDQRDFTKALAQILGSVIESHRLLEELRSKSLQQGTGSKALAGLIGSSKSVKNMLKRIRAAAPTDVTVLLDGESGTGKEMAALIVHQLSARRDKKFLALDCGSLPETLLESELFGYLKGSFTGANRDKAGLFEAADGGTVFLDEIASASPGVQARLLRVIEAGEVRRLGSETVSRVDVRMVCATNKDLEIEINEGRFREDLYYRLKVMKVDIPPLRERGDDVLILAEHFKNKYQKKHKKGQLNFSEGARRSIIIHSWPGNIRELENTIQKAVLLTQGNIITEKEMEIEGYYQESGQTIKQEMNYTQKEKILRILEATGKNYTKSAKIYGVSVRHFYRLLDKFGIKRDINVN